GKAGAKMPLSAVLTTGRPQAKTNTVSTSHGIHARTTTEAGCFANCLAPPGAGPALGLPASVVNASRAAIVGAPPAPASARPGIIAPPAAASACAASSCARWAFNEVDVQLVFGFHTCRKRIRQTIELIAAIASTSAGPTQLDT